MRTDKGKVIKSRMLGVQTAQIEEVLCSEGTAQRPGVSTRAICRRFICVEGGSSSDALRDGVKDRSEETLLVCVCVFFGQKATCVY